MVPPGKIIHLRHGSPSYSAPCTIAADTVGRLIIRSRITTVQFRNFTAASQPYPDDTALQLGIATTSDNEESNLDTQRSTTVSSCMRCRLDSPSCVERLLGPVKRKSITTLDTARITSADCVTCAVVLLQCAVGLCKACCGVA
eukprot:3638645-Amphidinium_carterae.1